MHQHRDLLKLELGAQSAFHAISREIRGKREFVSRVVCVAEKKLQCTLMTNHVTCNVNQM